MENFHLYGVQWSKVKEGCTVFPMHQFSKISLLLLKYAWIAIKTCLLVVQNDSQNEDGVVNWNAKEIAAQKEKYVLMNNDRFNNIEVNDSHSAVHIPVEIYDGGKCKRIIVSLCEINIKVFWLLKKMLEATDLKKYFDI